MEQERITGYDHRAPVKKQKKEQPTKSYIGEETCFLKIIKIDN